MTSQKKQIYLYHAYVFIGESLSEHHTSVTSLCPCVCTLVWTDHLP